MAGAAWSYIVSPTATARSQQAARQDGHAGLEKGSSIGVGLRLETPRPKVAEPVDPRPFRYGRVETTAPTMTPATSSQQGALRGMKPPRFGRLRQFDRKGK